MLAASEAIMTQAIDYGHFMHEAMQGVIARILRQVAEKGLPGAHHFFITFVTDHPKVELAPWLKERFPKEMTIVIQNWFEGLEVGTEGFGITLNFSNQPERLYIPFEALRTFVDPSVEFGLRFGLADDEDEEEGEDSAEEAAAPPAETPRPGGGEVVSLDQFRKT